MDKPTRECGECGGAGGWFDDRWGAGGHYTDDHACVTCDGTGEVEARCCCGGPAEHRIDVNEWLCSGCKAEGDAWEMERQAPVSSETPDSAADRIPTPFDGVAVLR